MEVDKGPEVGTIKTDKEFVEMPDDVKAETDPKEPPFPSKPMEETKKQSINSSLISLGLFIGAFYFIFKWDFTYILIIAGVLLIHELGHYLAMRAYKYKDLAIFFVPLVGAFASGSKDNISQKQGVIILLAGPLPGVIIGLIIYYFGLLDQNMFLLGIANSFLLLNLFNLLPVMPLDGGRLLKSMFFENKETINKVFIFISIALLSYYALTTQSYFFLIIPVLLLMQLSSQSQIKNVRKGAVRKGINLDKSYHELTDEEYWLIREEIGSHMNYFNRSIKRGQYVVAENEKKIVNQVKAIIEKKPTRDLSLPGKILITTLWIMTFIAPLLMIVIFYIRLGVDK